MVEGDTSIIAPYGGWKAEMQTSTDADNRAMQPLSLKLHEGGRPQLGNISTTSSHRAQLLLSHLLPPPHSREHWIPSHYSQSFHQSSTYQRPMGSPLVTH